MFIFYIFHGKYFAATIVDPIGKSIHQTSSHIR